MSYYGDDLDSLEKGREDFYDIKDFYMSDKIKDQIKSLESDIKEMEELRDRACEAYNKIVKLLCSTNPLSTLVLSNHLIELASCIGADTIIKDEIMIKRKPVTESENWWRIHDEKLNEYEKKLNEKGLLI